MRFLSRASHRSGSAGGPGSLGGAPAGPGRCDRAALPAGEDHGAALLADETGPGCSTQAAPSPVGSEGAPHLFRRPVSRTLLCGTAADRLARSDARRQASRAPHMGAFLSFLEAERPDVVFCTHQRALAAVPAMLAAKKLGIPSAVFSIHGTYLPKGRMAVYADTYIVWSDHMKRELMGFYPDVATERVRVVGTPQFENYFNDSPSGSRKRNSSPDSGLDVSRPVVCFSGNDITSPFDPGVSGGSCLCAPLRAAPGAPADPVPPLTGRHDRPV